MSFSRKPTCAFCEHEQNGLCTKKDSTVKLTKHRRCKFFIESKAKMVAEKLRQKFAIDRRIKEKRPMKIWEQSPSFYQEIWDEHYQRTVPHKIRTERAANLTVEQKEELEQKRVATANIPKYLPRTENIRYEN